MARSYTSSLEMDFPINLSCLFGPTFIRFSEHHPAPTIKTFCILRFEEHINLLCPFRVDTLKCGASLVV